MRGLLLLLALPMLAIATVEHQIQPATGNQLQLVVTKTGLMSGKRHLFEFSKYQGLVRFEKEHPDRSSVRIEIDARDLLLKDTWVSEKDRRKIIDYTHQTMLNTGQHPSLVFVSTKVEPAGEQVKVTGDLTVGGVTKPVVVFVKLKENSGSTMRFEGTSKFRMTDFGMKPPSAALGTIGTRDEVELTFSLTTQAR